MVKKVSTTEAKAKLSALVAEVAYGKQRIVIEKRGKPVAAMVSVDEVERLIEERPDSTGPRGALALVGAWREVSSRKLDAIIVNIYKAREQDTGRPVKLGL